MRYWRNKLPDSYSVFPQSILKHELSQILFFRLLLVIVPSHMN